MQFFIIAKGTFGKNHVDIWQEEITTYKSFKIIESNSRPVSRRC